MQSDSTRDRILNAAGPIFAQKGFKKATVREICQAAEVNLASVNYYFGDKSSLYRATLELARQLRSQEHPIPSFEYGTSPEEKLNQMIRSLVMRLLPQKSEPWPVRLMMREVFNPTEVADDLITSYFRPFFDSLLTVVDDVLGYRLNENERTQIGMSIIGQCLVYRTSQAMIQRMFTEAERESFTADQLTQRIHEFTLAALKGITPATLPETVSINQKN